MPYLGEQCLLLSIGWLPLEMLTHYGQMFHFFKGRNLDF